MFNRIYLFLLLLSGPLLKAQFSGPYATSNWGVANNNSNGSTSTAGAPAYIVQTGSDNNSGLAGTHDFTIVVPQTGQISFSWNYSTIDDPLYDYPMFILNGNPTLLNGYNTGGSATQSGSQPCVNVTQGQVFGFRMHSVDNVFGPATVTISNFVFSTGNLTVTPASPSICAGNTLVLTASGASSFTWSGGISNGVAFTPTASTIYTVQGATGGCISTKTVPVTFFPGIVVTPPNPVVCAGSSLTLNATGATTHTWDTGPTTSTISVSPTTATTYTVAGTTSNGCASTVAVIVNVTTSTPVLNVVNSNSTNGVCPGKSTTLTASGAVTYTWTGGISNGVGFQPVVSDTYVVTGENACGTSTAATSVSIHPNPTITAIPSQPSVCTQQSVAICGNGGVNYTIVPTQQNCTGFFPFVTQTYTLVGENGLGCRDTTQTTIQVVTTPANPPLSSHSLICIGSSATLAALGATDHTWTPGPFSTPSIVVSPNTTTTYTITKRNANCYDTQTIALIVNPLPTAFAVAQPTVVCAGTSASLSGCCGNSYTWSPGNLPSGPNAANITVYPQTDTEYTLAVSDGTCMNTSTVALATYTNPIISITTNTDYLCAGQTVNFNISGADNYTFANNPPTSPPLTGVTAAVQLSTTTNYMITGSNSSSCTSSAQKVIVVYPLPNISTSSTPTLVCVGGAANISAASSATSPAHQYVWTHNQQTGNSTVVNPTITSTYSVTGTNTVTGCVSDKTVSVAVFEPTFVTTSDTAICNKGTINLIASGATSFTWTGGQPGIHFISVSPSVTTIYSVTALSQTVNGLKCLSTQTVEVSIYNNPTITATHQRSVVCRGESVELYAKGADTYTWSNAGNKNGDTISVFPLNKTTYIVIGTDMFGCRDTSDVTVDFSNCTGFAEYQGRLHVSIYPNPSSGDFTIKGAGDMDLELLNELGQVIRVVRLTGNNQHTIQVEGVAAGVYYLRGKQQDSVVTEKVMVQR